MKVTRIRILLPSENSTLASNSRKDPETKLLAYATIELDGVLVLSHLRILSSKHGRRIVEMPSRPAADGRYVDIAYPKTEELRVYMRAQVLEEVRKHIPEDL